MGCVTFAFATQEMTPEPGLQYRVIGVAESDRLHVREAPGVHSHKIDALDPGRTDIHVSGVRAEVDGSVWWMIVGESVSGGTGWVNARYLTPERPEAERQSGYGLRCQGTEPFWSLVTSRGTARFSTPDAEVTEWAASPWLPASNRREIFAIRMQDGNPPGYLTARRDYNFCSDGMSDFQYPFHGVLIRPDGEVFSGCCARSGDR
jgi:uncharacterized membrane protein